MIEFEEFRDSKASIKVIGVGGGGCNAVNRMISSEMIGIEFIVVNTDAQALENSTAPYRLQIGEEITSGLGAGSDPQVGKNAAMEDIDRIKELITGADMVFITAGMGGGTGTGAAPVIAGVAKELDALTVAVVTKPFIFEGCKRGIQAEHGIQEIQGVVDSIISIPNDRLLNVAEAKTSIREAFQLADDVLSQAVQGIADLIIVPGLINLDFADVKAIMSQMGTAVMGTGVSSGEGRSSRALQAAISSPLLEESSIEGAKGILLNITGDSSLTLHEVNEAATAIHQVAEKDAHIIFGAVIDESMGDQIKITVIATGFKEKILSAPKKVEFTRTKAEATAESTERLSEINVRGGRRFPIREHFNSEYKERFGVANLDQPYLRKSEEG